MTLELICFPKQAFACLGPRLRGMSSSGGNAYQKWNIRDMSTGQLVASAAGALMFVVVSFTGELSLIPAY